MKNQSSEVNQALLDGIKTMISRGWTFEQIKKILLEKNYPEALITQYYNYAKQQPQPTTQNSSQNNQLIQIVDYIRNMETRGYSFQQIKSFLIQKGYSSNLIDEAAAHLPQQNIPQQNIQETNHKITTHRHEVHLPGRTALHIFAIFFGVIILIGGGYFFINMNNQSGALLDLIATPENTQVAPGEDLRFKLNILSMGAKETFDMYITYDILDQNLNVIDSSKDTIAIFTSAQHDKRITIPEDFEPGKYTMNIHSDYNGKMAQTRFDFRVKPPRPGITTDDQDPEDQTNTTTQDPEQQVNLHPIIERNEETETTTLRNFIDRILATSTTAESATNKCNNIKEQENLERCISTVSIEYENSEICSEITTMEIRDDCYLSHLLIGELQVCSQIEGNQTRSTCNLIRDLYLIQQYEDGEASLDDIINELGIEITTVEYIDEEIQVIPLEE